MIDDLITARRLYACAVCLIALIGLLIVMPRIVSAAFDLADPVNAKAGDNELRLSSYQAFEVDMLRTLKLPNTQAAGDAEYNFRKMYDALLSERVQSVQAQSIRTLATNGIVGLACLVLFITHRRSIGTDGLLDTD